MIKSDLVDHLFRHQYGKMVAILTRIFGLSHLEMIEDSIQDTFEKALLKWRNEIPENPEAWLTLAAKNRVIDLLRQSKTLALRLDKIESGPSSIAMNDLFLDHEIADSQLRMVFTACHPKLQPQDQISFALKTISGFGTKEIAAALLLKEETVKKRLSRARKAIVEQSLAFEIPSKQDIDLRLARVLEVIYLTYNEGYHSTVKDDVLRKDLCGEALRLSKLILVKEELRSADSYGLFALLCFHSSRLDGRLNEENELISLKDQDRTKWHQPLIDLGESALTKAMTFHRESSFLYEAAIAFEHASSVDFQSTRWDSILDNYKRLFELNPSTQYVLNQAIVLIQLASFSEAIELLESINPQELEQRAYLLHATYGEYYAAIGNREEALKSYEKAIIEAKTKGEKRFLKRKLKDIEI